MGLINNVKIIEIIKGFWLFNECQEYELQQFTSYFHEITVKKDAIIYFEGEEARNVYIILKGVVELGKTINKNKYNRISLLTDGDFFGTGEVFYDVHYINATAIQNSSLIVISKKDFFNHFIIHSSIYIKIMQDFTDLIKMNINMLQWDNSCNNKIIQFLYYLSKNIGITIDDEIFINLQKLNYESISNILNLSKEHFSRVLKKYKDEGKIRIINRQIIMKKQWLESVIIDNDFAESLTHVFNYV